MTENKAIEILQAKSTCMELEAEACVETKRKKGCDQDCDNCEFCYKQGTVGEQIEALQIAILALVEKMRQQS